MKSSEILKNGIFKENPVLRLILGCCPVLAVTTMAKNGLGMGIAATLVLIGSNFVISLLRNYIPKTVRIPAYITIIAGFVTSIQFLVKAYSKDIDNALGIFLPLIVVNCIILGRAEMFASKNKPLASVIDAIGMGLGFMAVLFIMGSIREIMGSGTWMGINLTKDFIEPFGVMALAPGGFFVFGVLIAAANKFSGYKLSKATSCGSCQGCGGCAVEDNNEITDVKQGEGVSSLQESPTKVENALGVDVKDNANDATIKSYENSDKSKENGED